VGSGARVFRPDAARLVDTVLERFTGKGILRYTARVTGKGSPHRDSPSFPRRPTEAGANVILAEPFDPVVYERNRELDGITYAAPSQDAVDLVTSPGRGPSEAEELMQWMARNEGDWRS
jgi:hypothetical protein